MAPGVMPLARGPPPGPAGVAASGRVVAGAEVGVIVCLPQCGNPGPSPSAPDLAPTRARWHPGYSSRMQGHAAGPVPGVCGQMKGHTTKQASGLLGPLDGPATRPGAIIAHLPRGADSGPAPGPAPRAPPCSATADGRDAGAPCPPASPGDRESALARRSAAPRPASIQQTTSQAIRDRIEAGGRGQFLQGIADMHQDHLTGSPQSRQPGRALRGQTD
jgi:hypothetical protein